MHLMIHPRYILKPHVGAQLLMVGTLYFFNHIIIVLGVHCDIYKGSHNIS
jgi:hypothetical protein